MDVFRLHEQLIGDYADFTRSFVDVRDARIHEAVEEAIGSRALWPDPWIQLNPNFERGATPDDLVEQDVLHPECAKIFRLKRFKQVFLPRLEPDTLGETRRHNEDDNTYRERLDLLRRQLFAAMTRARDRLWGGWVGEPSELLRISER